MGLVRRCFSNRGKFKTFLNNGHLSPLWIITQLSQFGFMETWISFIYIFICDICNTVNSSMLILYFILLKSNKFMISSPWQTLAFSQIFFFLQKLPQCMFLINLRNGLKEMFSMKHKIRRWAWHHLTFAHTSWFYLEDTLFSDVFTWTQVNVLQFSWIILNQLKN